MYLDHKEDYLKIIDRVASNGGFIMQNEKKDFEKELATFIGCKYAVGVGNCTDGLEIGWQSIGLRPGDEVICSSYIYCNSIFNCYGWWNSSTSRNWR